VHVSYNLGDNKKQVLTATKKDGKTVYLPGLVALRDLYATTSA